LGTCFERNPHSRWRRFITQKNFTGITLALTEPRAISLLSALPFRNSMYSVITSSALAGSPLATEQKSALETRAWSKNCLTERT
jgi:hypothetical protein